MYFVSNKFVNSANLIDRIDYDCYNMTLFVTFSLSGGLIFTLTCNCNCHDYLLLADACSVGIWLLVAMVHGFAP